MHFHELPIGSKFKFNTDPDNAVLQKVGNGSYVVLQADFSNVVNLRFTVDRRYMDSSDPNLTVSKFT